MKRIEYFDYAVNNNSPKQNWVILFHGYGADAHDLAGLKDFIQSTNQVNLRFPNGVFEVPIGPGWTGRAWWPLKMSSLPGDWSDHTPAEMNQLVPVLLKMISDLNIPWKNIILGGFSQGAMLATELYLQAPETPAGLISLSGSLIRQSIWTEKLKSKAHEKIFLSHGEQDQVLPAGGTQKLMKLLKENNVNCDWVSFQGGHEIPPKVIQRMNLYIADRFGEKQP